MDAHCEIAAPALFAMKAMSAVPADANALAGFPFSDAAPDRVDPSRNFVARDAGILKSGPDAVFDQNIAVTNAARLDFHPNLSNTRLQDVAFHQLPIPAWLADLRQFHFAHGLIRLWLWLRCTPMKNLRSHSNNAASNVAPD
jgi:hypothetical protein